MTWFWPTMTCESCSWIFSRAWPSLRIAVDSCASRALSGIGSVSRMVKRGMLGESSEWRWFTNSPRARLALTLVDRQSAVFQLQDREVDGGGVDRADVALVPKDVLAVVGRVGEQFL